MNHSPIVGLSFPTEQLLSLVCQSTCGAGATCICSAGLAQGAVGTGQMVAACFSSTRVHEPWDRIAHDQRAGMCVGTVWSARPVRLSLTKGASSAAWARRRAVWPGVLPAVLTDADVGERWVAAGGSAE